MRKYYLQSLLIVTMTFISSCHYTRKEYNKELITASNELYETSEFTYLSDNRSKRVKLCDVRYYVNGDTLFTSEKYHALFLSYSSDSTDNLSYTVAVYFDTSQQANVYGWYYLTLSDADIYRIPLTHLSAIRLRNYYGNLVNLNESYCWPDAVLYNATQEIVYGQDRDTITSQIAKLLPFIQ